MNILVALLVFLGGNVVLDWLLKKVPATKEIADPLATVLAILLALVYAGVVK